MIRATGRVRRNPVPVEDHLRPPGQVDPIVAPLDTLRAAWRDDLDVASRATVRDGGNGRCARTRPRCVSRADTPFPDEDADAIGRLDDRELDVRAVSKTLVRRQRRAEAMEARHVRKLLHQRDALRIPDRKRGHRQGFTGSVDLLFDDPLGLPHGGAKRVTAALPADERQGFPSRLGVDAHFRQRRSSATVRADTAPTPPGIVDRCRTAPTGCRRY